MLFRSQDISQKQYQTNMSAPHPLEITLRCPCVLLFNSVQDLNGPFSNYSCPNEVYYSVSSYKSSNNAFLSDRIVFLFHKNTNKVVKAKVKPPRLNGAKVGVFASRSPHRPNPIGLTLALGLMPLLVTHCSCPLSIY